MDMATRDQNLDGAVGALCKYPREKFVSNYSPSSYG